MLLGVLVFIASARLQKWCSWSAAPGCRSEMFGGANSLEVSDFVEIGFSQNCGPRSMNVDSHVGPVVNRGYRFPHLQIQKAREVMSASTIAPRLDVAPWRLRSIDVSILLGSKGCLHIHAALEV